MTKQQYLEAVAAWKAEHVIKINDIREAKIGYKNAQRAGVSVYAALNRLAVTRHAISDHLYKRQAMKEQAHRDYLASRLEASSPVAG